ncbi:MAG: hypothetical protein ACLTUM_04855 [Christensenellales bacterium]
MTAETRCDCSFLMSIKKLQVNTANIRKKFAGVSVPLPGIRNELGIGYRLDG